MGIGDFAFSSVKRFLLSYKYTMTHDDAPQISSNFDLSLPPRKFQKEFRESLPQAKVHDPGR